jgi:hypothetical protein
VPLCPAQIPHDLTWDRTRAAAVASQRLTAWAMARPEEFLTEDKKVLLPSISSFQHTLPVLSGIYHLLERYLWFFIILSSRTSGSFLAWSDCSSGMLHNRPPPPLDSVVREI